MKTLKELSDFSISFRDLFGAYASYALAMVLWMIGLGLGDEGDISVKGLKAVQRILDLRYEQYCQGQHVSLEVVLEHSLIYHRMGRGIRLIMMNTLW